MFHPYKVKKKKFRRNNTWEESNYAVGVYRGTIDIEGIADKLAERSTIKQPDLLGAVVGTTQLIEEMMHLGYKVNLNGLGIFYLSVSSDEGYKNPKDVTPHRVKAKKVCFKASQKLQKNLQFVKFERG
ncbi:MAG: hypothetical protein H6Q15_212 [Bacteroidetes bacterium]|nr:hypothetical protein [Bacteroidota bacterium]